MHIATDIDEIMVALDVPTVNDALYIVEQTYKYAGWYRIGLELITTQNAISLIESIKNQYGSSIFYDAKLYDTPEAIKKTVKALRSFPVDLVSISAASGVEAMREAEEASGLKLSIAATTVLPSMDISEMTDIGYDTNRYKTVEELTALWTKRAAQAHISVLACSSRDIPCIKQHSLQQHFMIIASEIYPTWAIGYNQNMMTPTDAINDEIEKIIIDGSIILQADQSNGKPIKLIYEEVKLAHATRRRARSSG